MTTKFNSLKKSAKTLSIACLAGSAAIISSQVIAAQDGPYASVNASLSIGPSAVSLPKTSLAQVLHLHPEGQMPYLVWRMMDALDLMGLLGISRIILALKFVIFLWVLKSKFQPIQMR